MRIIVTAVMLVIVGNVCAETASARTSIDIYCETMVTALVETSLLLSKKPPSQEKLKKVGEIEAETLKLCKSTPAVGEAKLQSEMTPQEITVISCLAIAEGISTAYNSEYESYAKLSERRTFAANSCSSNSKAFLNDIYKNGPDYVMSQRY